MSFLESLPRPTKVYHTTTYERIAERHGFNGTDKTVLVTGGASGLGLNFARAFAKAGVHRIAIVSRSSEQLEKAKTELDAISPSTQILSFQASVTDHARMDDILTELGTIDVLVLNAGVAHRRAQATEITTEEMRDAFETNVIAVFNLTKAYLNTPAPKSGTKTIINISSGAAHLTGPFRVGYGPSKAAGAQIMQAFAAQYQHQREVRIFSLHPGSYYTPGVAKNMPKSMVNWEDEDLSAHFALWLAGPESDFLHGHFVWANWDVDELIMLKERLRNERNLLTISLVQPEH